MHTVTPRSAAVTDHTRRGVTASINTRDTPHIAAVNITRTRWRVYKTPK